MKKELDEALCRDFPNVFKNRHGDMRSTAMCWGFDCGAGWEPLIREAAAKLEALIIKHKEQHPEDEYIGIASQIKEKYGTLCFYISCGTDEMWAVVEEAEKKSETVCEQCGEPGSLRGRSWYYTACDAHTKG